MTAEISGSLGKPLVTLALLAYNQERFVAEAVEGALAQDYSNLEIILSDDASSDRTFQIMQATAASRRCRHRVVVRRNDSNLGLAAHINLVLNMSQGAFICWFAGDDVALPGKVSKLVAPMVEDPTINGTHSPVNVVDAFGRFLGVKRPPVPELIDSARQVIEEELMVASQSHAFRKSVWDRYGELDESVTNESAVMAFREATAGKILLVPEPLTNYRVGVGVSTQRGTSVDSLAIREPVKYASWWATGFEQIAKDARKAGVSTDLLRLIEAKRRYFDARLAINERPWAVGALLGSMFRPGVLSLFRAFLRRNSPRVLLRKVYEIRGWLE